MNRQDENGTFWEHLEVLRQTLIQILYILVLGTCIAFAFSQPIIQFLIKPFEKLKQSSQNELLTLEVKTYRLVNSGKSFITYSLPHDHRIVSNSEEVQFLDNQSIVLAPLSWIEWEVNSATQNLFLLSPLEGFSLSLKISLWLGAIITAPFWSYLIVQFIAPALHKKEKRLIYPLIGLSVVFMFFGLGTAYLITIPLANKYFFIFNQDLGLNLWSLTSYVDFTVLLMLAHAIVFELFMIQILLVHYGILKAQKMKEKRRHVIVAAFILAALITPPDVPSQLMMAIPMVIFYEISIFYAFLREKSTSILAPSLNPNTN